MLQYRTEIADAGMLIPSASAWMSMLSYDSLQLFLVKSKAGLQPVFERKQIQT
jgi:hypothetical protein